MSAQADEKGPHEHGTKDRLDMAVPSQATLGPVSLAELNRRREQIRRARREHRHATPPPPFQPGGGLWLTVTNLDETHLQLTLYNTLAGKNYRLESSPTFWNPHWVFFREVTGTGGTVTELVDTDDQPMGFFRVVFEPVPQFGFEGMGYATTQIDPPDIAAAVGPNHIVQLLNSKLVIFDKAGNTLDGPMDSAGFFQANDAVDPRVLYDSRRDRWVASSLDRSVPLRKVTVAVSKGPVPTTSPADWWRYTTDFSNFALPLADFDTLGMDANGVYLSVLFFDSGRKHAVVGFPKDSFYNGNFEPTVFRVEPPELNAEIIQPAINLDDLPGDGPAWFVAKGVADPGPPYRGGAIYFRRLRWVGNQAEWLDNAWDVIDDAGNNYRNYFDLDDSTIGAPQPQDGQSGSFDIRIDETGSRLCQPIVRDGFLWVAQHVGLSGSHGEYTGGPDGLAVDRSAIQWFKLAIQPTGIPLTYAGHGRIFDRTGWAPVWYHFPSVAVNGVGDCLFGFSGSGTTTYLSAFSAWKPPFAPTADQPTRVKEGLEVCLYNRGADFSSTCVDPSDDLSFWTFQEYASGDIEFSTFIVKELRPR